MTKKCMVGFLLVGCLLFAFPDPVCSNPTMTPSAFYNSVGVTVGGAFHPNYNNGVLVGGELSIVRLFGDAVWMGGYADGLRDFGADATRYSIGPEFGFAIFGFDVGYMGQIDKNAYRNGLSARFLLTFPIVSIYGRWGHLFGDSPEHNFGEVGLLIKVPIELPIEIQRSDFFEEDGYRPPTETLTEDNSLIENASFSAPSSLWTARSGDGETLPEDYSKNMLCTDVQKKSGSTNIAKFSYSGLTLMRGHRYYVVFSVMVNKPVSVQFKAYTNDKVNIKWNWHHEGGSISKVFSGAFVMTNDDQSDATIELSFEKKEETTMTEITYKICIDDIGFFDPEFG